MWQQALLKYLHEDPQTLSEPFTKLKLYWTLNIGGVTDYLIFQYDNLEQKFSMTYHNPNLYILLCLFGLWQFTFLREGSNVVLNTNFQLLNTPAQLTLVIDKAYQQKMQKTLVQANELLKLLD